MFNNLTFKLAGVDITHLLDKSTFPEYLEESMKGDGYFEYEIQPLVFTINVRGSGISPARGQWVEIVDNTTGLFLLQGKVDEIECDEGPQPEITVFPQALLLKDTVVGDLETLSDGEDVTDFEFSIRHIRDTVNDILSRVNAKHGTNMYANDVSIPDFENTGRFFGDEISRFGGFRLAQSILNLLGYDDEVYFRKNDAGQYFMIHKDGDFYSKVVATEGQWVNVSFSKTWTILGTEFGFNFGRIKVPSSDFSLPYITTKNHVWQLTGSIEYLGDFSDESQFGDIYTGKSATNVPEDKFTAFGTEQGMKTNQKVDTSFDYDSGNSYAMVSGNFRNDFSGHTILETFQTAFDDEYAGHYRNSTAMEIIRDLAVVANRWFYVDRDGLVYLLPREQARGTVSLSAENTISETKRIRKEQDIDIKINRYVEDKDGKVTEYGLKLRANEVDVIKSRYREIFAGEVVERELEILRLDDDTILKNVDWDYKPELDNIGVAIASKRAFLEPRTIVRVEKNV